MLQFFRDTFENLYAQETYIYDPSLLSSESVNQEWFSDCPY